MEKEKNTCRQDSEVSIETAVQNAQLMVAYIANKKSIAYKSEALDTIVESKYLMEENNWSRQSEIAFWIAYKELASQIHPVTINSLESSLAKPYCSTQKKITKTHSKASKTASNYRVLAFVTLVALLCAQIYYIIGANVASEMESIFEERQKVRLEMDRVKNLKGLRLYGKYIAATDDEELNRLSMQNKIYNQKLDANYQILLKWNRIWQALLLNDQYVGKLREYRRFEHNELVKFTQNFYADQLNNLPDSKTDDPNTSIEMKERMLTLKLDYAAMKARNKLLVTQISAKFVLISLQTYFLPLLYGLMGAIMYALRMLANEIKNLTYDTDSQIRYRLRIFIGAIAGLMIGLFINPEEIEVFNLIAPMAISFIAGYNVELLFSFMDRIIQELSKKTKPEDMAASIHPYAEAQVQYQRVPEKQNQRIVKPGNHE
jgi:hypothetical protein